jgi:hypothetical protein
VRRALLLSWLLLIAGLACIGQSSAYWQSRDSNYNKAITGVTGYQGPGDVVSGAFIAASCARAYNAAYAATQGPLCDIVDTATGLATCTINAGTNGFANVSSIQCPTAAPTVSVATFCTVTHATGCSVTKMYDQSGANACSGAVPCNVIQVILAQMPILTLSALNSLPCSLFASSASTVLLNTGALASIQAQPFSTSQVVERTANFTAANGWFGVSSSLIYSQFNNAANQVDIGASGQLNSSTNVTDNVFHAIQMVWGNNVAAASNIQTDSLTQVTGNAGTGSWGTGRINIGVDQYSNFLTGYVCEFVAYPAALTNPQETSLNSNQHGTNGYNF